MGILLRQSLKSSFASYLGVVIGAMNIIYLFPKFILPEQLGMVKLILAISATISQIGLLGFSNTLPKFFNFYRSKNTTINLY